MMKRAGRTDAVTTLFSGGVRSVAAVDMQKEVNLSRGRPCRPGHGLYRGCQRTTPVCRSEEQSVYHNPCSMRPNGYGNRGSRPGKIGYGFIKIKFNMFVRVLFSALLLHLVSQSQTVVAQKRPELLKLPFAFSDMGRTPMENTPFYFDSKLMMVANHRPGGADANGKDAYLYIDDMRTGQEVSRFGQGHSFVSAFSKGAELNVFALEFSDFGRIMNSKGINRLVTRDLKNWKQEVAISPEGGEHLFNSSVCEDEQGYLMAYESDKPVQFCFKFARSKDLSKWEKIPGLVYTGEKKEYSACPVIRYFKPYYYVIYLHAAVKGHNGWVSYLSRSKDLKEWELSPFNPILEAEAGEGKNNSDVDLIEYEGKTFLYYATGDQETWSTIRAAMYDGPMRTFFEGYFPQGKTFVKLSAKQN
ncbi:hypothetical protein DYBT9275_04791 [Dyadobacter sp. CECT 9275]|uniref:Glycosyl hydrolase family 32 N-terminal domain-containing protein n=1 Tax=Dyadobacter helix TaxID=2822344 RepID=A0A916JGE4_9BACT|nr:hypothetical protein [Dyadobacter sp. CECT 9275]CAG5010677.1 hypothetical protein DYBT9275_04791 [Dyadobacter sp. CECT 9275]